MTLKAGSSQACAACKYQRRKCTPECQLAPYFPPDKPKMFLNAHKLFGVSNIHKILKHLDPNQKAEAMSSIIYQSNVRARFPVHGCVEVIQYYWNQIRQCEQELETIHSLIAMYQQQQQQQQQQQDQQIPTESLDLPSQLQLGMAPPTNNAIPFYQQSDVQIPPPSPSSFAQPQNYSYSSSSNNAYNTGYSESIEPKDDVVSLTSNQPHLADLEASTVQQVLEDYDEMKPYFDASTFDRLSYVDSKKAYDSSPESSMTDAIQSIEHVVEKELKTAATCFSLTNRRT